MRVIVSVPLPGPNGTMMLTGLVGYDCPLAMREKAGKAAAPRSQMQELSTGKFQHHALPERLCVSKLAPRCTHRESSVS